MVLKRKRSPQVEDSDASEAQSELSIEEVAFSEEETDIFSSLMGSGPAHRNAKVALGGDEDDEDEDEIIRQSMAKKRAKDGTDLLKKLKGKAKITKGEVGGGSFQSMALQPWLLRSLTMRGYRIPTPIQRIAIPPLLATPPQDLVGMARTGSGKTLAYMIPLLQRLGGSHSTSFGARALILLPTRELALQVMKVGKELARGKHAAASKHAGDSVASEDAKSQALRWGLLIGGEGMDEQFEIMASNPDVIIATPGRLLHLIVEANLDLRSVQYVVFDEADRLFEMGFDTAMNEILGKLPSSRQTLLFSATLPKSLVEFAKAGLQNPKLVRLDADSKISTDLRMAFFSIKQNEKDACLLSLLRDTIEVPTAQNRRKSDETYKKSSDSLLPHQTLIFAATKHHVEYLTQLLTTAGYSVSHIYGTLDQYARSSQMDRFRKGQTSILVVTDVAARGIDIPVLENVINYDFPRGARVFVHRVGRTARAGKKGWAWSFVTNAELPFLIDLQLFLGRPFKHEVVGSSEVTYTQSLVLGPFSREQIDEDLEHVKSLDENDASLTTLRAVMIRGHGMYERSQGKASSASYTRGKEMLKDPKWGFTGPGSGRQMHPVLRKSQSSNSTSVDSEAKSALLKAVTDFRPSETVFEVGSRGKNPGAAVMKDRRVALGKAQKRAVVAKMDDGNEEILDQTAPDEQEEDDIEGIAMFEASSLKGKSIKSHKDEEFYMSHYQKDAMTDKGYSLKDGASFEEQARGQIFSLQGDEAALKRQRHHSQLTWDKKKKKFIKGTGEGADNAKMVKTESGTKLPASYRSGRFEEWQNKNRLRLPKVGEQELPQARLGPSHGGNRKFKHTKMTAPKTLDKQHVSFERKSRQLKKRTEEGNGAASMEGEGRARGRNGKAGKSRYGDKPIGRVKNEIKTVDQIRKARDQAAKRKAKNARPSKKKGRR